MKFFPTLFISALLTSATAFGLSPFELPLMNGQNASDIYRSSDNRAAIYILEAYFNNCPYCHENAPIIEEVADKFKDEPRVHVLDVGRDCRTSDYTRWINQHNPKHPVVNDCNKQVITEMGVNAFPTMVVYDCWGRERFRNIGVLNSAKKAELVSLVEGLLREACPIFYNF